MHMCVCSSCMQLHVAACSCKDSVDNMTHAHTFIPIIFNNNHTQIDMLYQFYNIKINAYCNHALYQLSICFSVHCIYTIPRRCPFMRICGQGMRALVNTIANHWTMQKLHDVSSPFQSNRIESTAVQCHAQQYIIPPCICIM